MCDNNGTLGSKEFHKIIEENLKKSKSKLPAQFDFEWTQNAFNHSVWKLAGCARFLNKKTCTKYLSPQNIVYQIMKKYNKEFSDGKQSFF